jgi:hypothetical protein
MLKSNYYECDGGAVAVEMEGSVVWFSNDVGDGMYKVFVDDTNELSDDVKDSLRFKQKAFFKNAHVLDYDCLHNIKSSTVIRNHSLFELNGVYGIYTKNGNVYFIKWED